MKPNLVEGLPEQEKQRKTDTQDDNSQDNAERAPDLCHAHRFAPNVGAPAPEHPSGFSKTRTDLTGEFTNHDANRAMPGALSVSLTLDWSDIPREEPRCGYSEEALNSED